MLAIRASLKILFQAPTIELFASLMRILSVLNGMQLRTSFFLCFILDVLLSFSSCQDKNIAGHWHIHNSDKTNVDYMTLDMLQDSVAILNRYASDGGVIGSYSTSNKEIVFPGDCGSGHFKYAWNGNDLNLENDLEVRRIAIRLDSTCCDLLEDVLHDSRLQLSLPHLVVNRDCISPYVGTVVPLTYGKSKYLQCYNVSRRMLELSGKIANTEDVSIWMDSVASKYPEGKQNRISFAIFGDKDLPVIELETIVEELLKSGAKRIFVATLNPDFRKSNSIFEYVAIHDVNLKSGLTLGELLY